MSKSHFDAKPNQSQEKPSFLAEPDDGAPNPDLPRISYVIARLDRVVKQHMVQALEPYGITVAQYTALSILGRRGHLSNAQLAKRTYVSPQGMNQILNKLDQAGWIVREPHATHRRIKTIRLSEEGREVLTECDRRVQRIESDMLRHIEIEDHQRINTLLIECVRSLQGGFSNLDIS